MTRKNTLVRTTKKKIMDKRIMTITTPLTLCEVDCEEASKCNTSKVKDDVSVEKATKLLDSFELSRRSAKCD